MRSRQADAGDPFSKTDDHRQKKKEYSLLARVPQARYLERLVMSSDVEQGGNAGIEPQTQASGTESENRASPNARAAENTEHVGETVGTSGGSPSGGGSRERNQDYPFTRDVCNVVLLGLLASFICIFTWAWVDAFQKVKSLKWSMIVGDDRAINRSKFSGMIGVRNKLVLHTKDP